MSQFCLGSRPWRPWFRMTTLDSSKTPPAMVVEHQNDKRTETTFVCYIDYDKILEESVPSRPLMLWWCRIPQWVLYYKYNNYYITTYPFNNTWNNLFRISVKNIVTRRFTCTKRRNKDKKFDLTYHYTILIKHMYAHSCKGQEITNLENFLKTIIYS